MRVACPNGARRASDRGASAGHEPLAAPRHSGGSAARYGQQAQELEEQVGGEERGDLGGSVELRRDLHEIEAGEVESPQAPNQAQGLVAGEAAHLRRPRGGRIGGVHRVDVEGHVDLPAGEPPELLRGPPHAPILDLVEGDDLHAVFGLEVEVRRLVEWAPNSELDRPPGIDDALFHRTTEHRAVEILRAEVLVPAIRVAIEMDEPHRAVAPRDRTQDGQRDRMVAAHADGDDVRVEELANLLLDHLEGALDGNGHDVDVAVVGDAQPFEGRDALGMTVGANHGGLGADLAGAEARAGAVGGAAVERDAEQRHFEGAQLTAVGQTHEGGDPAEAGRDKGVGWPELAHVPFPPRRRSRGRPAGLAGPLSAHSRSTIWAIQSVIRAYTFSPYARVARPGSPQIPRNESSIGGCADGRGW